MGRLVYVQLPVRSLPSPYFKQTHKPCKPSTDLRPTDDQILHLRNKSHPRLTQTVPLFRQAACEIESVGSGTLGPKDGGRLVKDGEWVSPVQLGGGFTPNESPDATG